MKILGNGPWDKGYEPSGISKAQEAAFKVYPYESGVKGLICENSRQLFIQGYEQAEKDLSLTWEDIKTIEQIITTSDWYDFEINGTLWSKEFYEEILKRFKKVKND